MFYFYKKYVIIINNKRIRSKVYFLYVEIPIESRDQYEETKRRREEKDKIIW